MFNWFKRKRKEIAVVPNAASGLFSTQGEASFATPTAQKVEWPVPVIDPTELATMDANDFEDSIKAQFTNNIYGVPDAQAMWYAAQGFIGYRMCAMLAQHWLVEKACKMPGADAVRKGYEVTVNDGVEVAPEVIAYINKMDKKFRIKQSLIEYVHFGRVFGIRVALFVVKSTDKEYYSKPFNIDGVTAGSYKGISQIDPYWMVPELKAKNLGNPANLGFYDPEYWQIGDKRYHKSHLIIYRCGQVPDVLKPLYLYGGVSVPQRIYERVYASERTANEAPLLAMTKRLTVMFTDLSKAIANEVEFTERMNWWIQNRDNYGVKFAGETDKVEQHDTALSDLDNVIMTQYQLVAAIAEVPGTKLLGTQPKGFNSTGDYEEASYHEMLESMQENDLSPLLERHHMILIKSHVMPKFGTQPFTVDVSWNELDAMTAEEVAKVNLAKAQTDTALQLLGAIDAQDVRNRLINDPDSGYNGLPEELPPMPDTIDPNDPEADAEGDKPAPSAGGGGSVPEPKGA